MLIPAAVNMANRKPASINTRKKTFLVVSLKWIRVSETTWRSDAAVENDGMRYGQHVRGAKRLFFFDHFPALALLRRIGEREFP